MSPAEELPIERELRFVREAAALWPGLQLVLLRWYDAYAARNVADFVLAGHQLSRELAPRMEAIRLTQYPHAGT